MTTRHLFGRKCATSANNWLRNTLLQGSQQMCNLDGEIFRSSIIQTVPRSIALKFSWLEGERQEWSNLKQRVCCVRWMGVRSKGYRTQGFGSYLEARVPANKVSSTSRARSAREEEVPCEEKDRTQLELEMLCRPSECLCTHNHLLMGRK